MAAGKRARANAENSKLFRQPRLAQTIERQGPLFDPFLPLHLQVRTILTVPPLDCC